MHPNLALYFLQVWTVTKSGDPHEPSALECDVICVQVGYLSVRRKHDLKYREGHALCRTPTGSTAEELAPGRRRGEPRSPRSVAVCFPAALGEGPMLALTAGLLPRRDDAILRAPTRVEPFAARAASATPDSRAEGSLPARRVPTRPWHGV
ncbi:hypothetical protein MRX96_030980 [Rhipicephalus microplus]